MNNQIQAFSKSVSSPALSHIKRLAPASFRPFLKIFPLLILLSLFWQPASPLSAQDTDPVPLLLPENPHFNHLTTQDGLAHNHVSAIIQDHYGFMWFGTESGLNRSDGYRFDPQSGQYTDTYHYQLEGSSAFADLIAENLRIDSRGRQLQPALGREILLSTRQS